MNLNDMLDMTGLIEAQGEEMKRMAAVIDRYDEATDQLLDEISDTLDFVIQRIEAGDIAGCLEYCKARRTKIHGGLDDAVADEIIRQIRQEDADAIRETEA